jgi:hypothetical protein
MQHTAYSPALAPSDRHLFGPFKQHLQKRHFTSNDEVHADVRSWLIGLDTDFFCSGTGNLVKRRDKRLSKYGDYVEK